MMFGLFIILLDFCLIMWYRFHIRMPNPPFSCMRNLPKGASLMSVTIKDIAAGAGVSVSTVSRVLNQKGYVSEDARSRVLDVIARYHFRPNNSARNLRSNSSRCIGLFVKGITNPFFSKMIRVIEEKTTMRGYSLLIQNVDDRENAMAVAIAEAQSRTLCGVLLMGGSFGYTQEQFNRLGIPCVLITIRAGDEIPRELYSSVSVDDEKAGYRATQYLLSLGHLRIGFVYGCSSDRITPNRLRFLGYRRALEECGVPFDPLLVADSGDASLYSGYPTGFNAARSLYARCPDMTAVFAFADVLALGVMKGIFSLGLRVPEDISVVGFDGIEAGEYYHPSLDTILQPASEMALSGTEFLFNMIQGGPAQHLVYDTVLARRGSCRALSRG